MSRRFGRNQKRRMREELERLQSLFTEATTMLDQAARDFNKLFGESCSLRDQLGLVAETLGPRYIALDAKELGYAVRATFERGE